MTKAVNLMHIFANLKNRLTKDWKSEKAARNALEIEKKKNEINLNFQNTTNKFVLSD